MGKAYKLGDTKNIVDSISTLSSTVSTHTNTKGNASTFGHVKLSDNYTSSAGAAANNVGASSKAVNDAYTALQTSFQAGVDTIYDGFVKAGTTPTAKTPAALSTAVTTHGTAKYNSGYSAGVTATKVGTAGAADVLSGKTFTNGSSVGVSGTMVNKSNTTQDGTLSSDATYTYLGIPAAGYYNTGAKLRTLNSKLKGTEMVIPSISLSAGFVNHNINEAGGGLKINVTDYTKLHFDKITINGSLNRSPSIEITDQNEHVIASYNSAKESTDIDISSYTAISFGINVLGSGSSFAGITIVNIVIS